MSSIPATAAATTTPLYAGFWRRVAAYSIDSMVIMVIMVGFEAILLSFSDESLARIGSVVVVVGSVVALVFFFGYFIVMHSSALQATVGKLLMGVKVTDREGNRIGIRRSLNRFLGMFVSGIILGVGYVMAGVTERRQALHDMIAGTLVVRRDATPAEIVAGSRAMPVTMPVTVGVWGTIVGFIVVSILFNIVSAILMPNT